MVRSRGNVCADGATEFGGPARVFTFPKRHPCRLPCGRCHQDPVVRDRVDPPRRRPQEEYVSYTSFVDHFLIELAHTGPAATIGQENAVVPTIRNRPAIEDCQALATAPREQPIRVSIPADFWS